MTFYGYSDGSGEYFVVIDAEKCDGCGLCVGKCPSSALELEPMFIDLEEKTVAVVLESHRKKIKYTCSACKPEKQETPCILACPKQAIRCVWNPR